MATLIVLIVDFIDLIPNGKKMLGINQSTDETTPPKI